MRIAIIADTHGNLISLDAVLAEIEREGIERVVCLGDVAGLGPQPRGVLERLRRLGWPVVMGNADEFLLDPSLIDPERHPDVDEHTRRLHDMERWCAAQLGPDDLDYVRTFRATVEVPLEDGDILLCYHGSPRSKRDEIRGSTSDATLRAMLGDELAPAATGRRASDPVRGGLRLVGRGRPVVMAGGHTHEQFARRLDGSFVINPGSVGLPYEVLPGASGRNPPWAEYAVVAHDGGRLGVDLRRVPVDQAAIRRAILQSGMPHAEVWAADWR